MGSNRKKLFFCIFQGFRTHSHPHKLDINSTTWLFLIWEKFPYTNCFLQTLTTHNLFSVFERNCVMKLWRQSCNVDARCRGDWSFANDLKLLPFPFCTTESFDGRDKPSVLVTSPGSPDFNFQQKLQAPAHSKRPIGRYQGRFSQSSSIDPNIGGRMQIKLGFEASALQLILTIVCAADLTYRPNGAARNPYAKVSDENSSRQSKAFQHFPYLSDIFASLSLWQIQTSNENIS